jgi:tRNA(adenine34) deaminase
VLNQEDDTRWMRQALQAAAIAFEDGEVPVGCVIVQDDRVVGRGWNRTESAGDPTAHAEILAISAAASTLGTTRLTGAKVYVTLEPCLMCAGALLLARVQEVIFGAPEAKFGALGSRLNILEVEGFNHRYLVRSGVLAQDAASLMQSFFQSLRKGGGPPPAI